jgi:hypothetical protein
MSPSSADDLELDETNPDLIAALNALDDYQFEAIDRILQWGLAHPWGMRSFRLMMQGLQGVLSGVDSSLGPYQMMGMVTWVDLLAIEAESKSQGIQLERRVIQALTRLQTVYGYWLRELTDAATEGFRDWTLLTLRPFVETLPNGVTSARAEVNIERHDSVSLQLQGSVDSLVRLATTLVRQIEHLPRVHIADISDDVLEDLGRAVNALSESRKQAEPSEV